MVGDWQSVQRLRLAKPVQPAASPAAGRRGASTKQTKRGEATQVCLGRISTSEPAWRIQEFVQVSRFGPPWALRNISTPEVTIRSISSWVGVVLR